MPLDVAHPAQGLQDLRLKAGLAQIVLEEADQGLRDRAVRRIDFEEAAGLRAHLVREPGLARLHRIVDDREKDVGDAAVILIAIRAAVEAVPVIRDVVGPLALILVGPVDVAEQLVEPVAQLLGTAAGEEVAVPRRENIDLLLRLLRRVRKLDRRGVRH